MANPVSPPNGNTNPQSLDYLLPDAGGNAAGTGGNAGYIKRGKGSYAPTGAADKTANAVVETHADGDTFSADPIEVVVAGVSGTVTKALSVDSSGRPVVAGAGTAGTPAGGVLTVQGAASGTALPVSVAPVGTDVTASVTGAASAITATLPAAAGKTTYITGFEVTGGGATAASVVAVTVTGTVTGTLSYRIAVPAGATAGITPLVVEFTRPIPASAANTAITVNVPSLGAGNTDAAAAAHGYQA